MVSTATHRVRGNRLHSRLACKRRGAGLPRRDRQPLFPGGTRACDKAPLTARYVGACATIAAQHLHKPGTCLCRAKSSTSTPLTSYPRRAAPPGGFWISIRPRLPLAGGRGKPCSPQKAGCQGTDLPCGCVAQVPLCDTKPPFLPQKAAFSGLYPRKNVSYKGLGVLPKHPPGLGAKGKAGSHPLAGG